MKHRTAVVTAASIAVVILAATAAIAANLGILNSATDTGDVGALTVTSSVLGTAPASQVVQIEDTEAAVTSSESDSQPAGEVLVYAVGDAGIVTLVSENSMLTVLEVTTNPGWQTAQVLDGTGVDIGFVNTDGTVLRFVAGFDTNGTVTTAVDDLTPVVSSNNNRKYDDDDDEHHDDDDGYDDDDD
ncbi:MAG TPA: hypothetical protein ENH00_06895 [Actinobacteria bacterium]|nr:hypothetical protein [Actinomycetota bacterium]